MVCIDSWKPDRRARGDGDAPACAGRCWCRPWRCSWPIRPGAEGTLSALTAMTVGGGPMNAGALGRAEQTLGHHDPPGLRDVRVPRAHHHRDPATTPRTRLGRDGRPFPGTEVRAVDDDGRAAAGRGGGRRAGPRAEPVRRLRPRRPATPPELTADGFLPTGDLVRVDRRRHDHRSWGGEKQIIIRGGRNIDINEVEAAVARIPSVAQVCVVPVPDELLGERAAALVVAVGPGLTLEDVTRLPGRERRSRSPSGRSSCSSCPTCRRTGWASCRGPTRSSLATRLLAAEGDLSSPQFAMMVVTDQAAIDRDSERGDPDGAGSGWSGRAALQASGDPRGGDRQLRAGRLRAHKWAKIADEVGIGQTALYHYFESKAHCLLTIMSLELEPLARALPRGHGRGADRPTRLCRPPSPRRTT